MNKLELGKKIPVFTANATSNNTISSKDWLSHWVILYFYPKDNTPGCTTEGIDFRKHYHQFKKLDAIIFGISRDSLKAHENFKQKCEFPFELISDDTEELCKLFDVIKMKNLYGRQSLGIERSTFLIDPKGVLRHEWRKVKVAGHVQEVLDTLKKLSVA